MHQKWICELKSTIFYVHSRVRDTWFVWNIAKLYILSSVNNWRFIHIKDVQIRWKAAHQHFHHVSWVLKDIKQGNKNAFQIEMLAFFVAVLSRSHTHMNRNIAEKLQTVLLNPIPANTIFQQESFFLLFNTPSTSFMSENSAMWHIFDMYSFIQTNCD